ncbi:hypothetical protein FOZ63_000851, partial [Perkinsus olseni]
DVTWKLTPREEALTLGDAILPSVVLRSIGGLKMTADEDFQRGVHLVDACAIHRTSRLAYFRQLTDDGVLPRARWRREEFKRLNNGLASLGFRELLWFNDKYIDHTGAESFLFGERDRLSRPHDSYTAHNGNLRSMLADAGLLSRCSSNEIGAVTVSGVSAEHPTAFFRLPDVKASLRQGADLGRNAKPQDASSSDRADDNPGSNSSSEQSQQQGTHSSYNEHPREVEGLDPDTWLAAYDFKWYMMWGSIAAALSIACEEERTLLLLNRNPLLMRDEVGQAKPTYYDLPNEGFVYGKSE